MKKAVFNRGLSAICAGLVLFTAAHAAAEYAVWACPQGKWTSVLRYAVKSGGKWLPPAQLPLDQGLHIAPVLAEDRKQTLWIVWVERTADRNFLRYAAVRQGKIEKSGRVCSAENEQSYAPAILIDRDDAPWIAWSGVTTGQLADIYASRWNGRNWETPVLVHERNKTPDISPVLGLRGGKDLWVSWLGMNREESHYVRYLALFGKGRWQVNNHTFPVEGIADFLKGRTVLEPLPEQAGERLGGALFAGRDWEVQAVSDQLAAFAEK